MHFFNSIVSFAALVACITPVLSAPVAEPNMDLDAISLVAKRGALSDPAQTCYDGVKSKCDSITTKIDGAVDAKIDADVALAILVDLKAIISLIVNLNVDLQVKIKDGGLHVGDVKKCVTIVIAIVDLIILILGKILAHLSVSAKVFLLVVVELKAIVVIVINLCISVCQGKTGGLKPVHVKILVDLVIKLTVSLNAFVKACAGFGA